MIVPSQWDRVWTQWGGYSRFCSVVALFIVVSETTELRALCLPAKCSATELYPQHLKKKKNPIFFFV